MKKILLCSLCLCFVAAVFGQQNYDGVGNGPDNAYPIIEEILKKMPLKAGELYEMQDAELEKLVDAGAEIQINLFELLDCMHRYLGVNNFRLRLTGQSMRNLSNRYCLAEGTLEKLLPIALFDYLEVGASFESTQNALDVFLTEKYSADLEIGTGLYETHFGFKKMEPRLFSECFGLTVKAKVLAIKKAASKLSLYENGKGAFYVRGFFKPKRWYLSLITKLPQTTPEE